MPKKVKAKEVEAVETGKELLDGGVVATAITKEQSDKLSKLCVRKDRKPAWILREAVKMYLANEAV